MSEIAPSSPETPNGTALDFCIRLSRAYTETTRRIDARLSSIHGLSFSDFMILYHLSRAHGARLRRVDLADCMGQTASAVTRSLLPLEKIGWVERQSDPRDARVGYACMTPAGTRLFTDANRTAEAVCRDVLQAVPLEQISSLQSVLRQITGMSGIA